MSRIDHMKTEGLSGAPLFGPCGNHIGVTTPSEFRTTVRSEHPASDGPPVELARTFLGEGGPADAVFKSAAKGARSAGGPFELAAVLCGHDPLTVVGAADARHDRRVWDLLEESGEPR